MIIESEELSDLLKEEDSYISSLLKKWQQKELPAETEHKLRIGKRLELLGDLQHKKTGCKMNDKEAKDFLVKKIEYFLNVGVQKTSGEYSEANNQCRHGNHGYQGCQWCVEAYFAEVLNYVNS